jgi:hypothetical protein
MMNYIYESKCRSCGEISSRTFAAVSSVGFAKFSSEMEARAIKPQHYECAECGGMTEQDVVFYGIDSQPLDRRRYSMIVD